MVRGEPPTIRAWREWLRHQYEPGYWVGARIPPFFAGSRDDTPARWGVRWVGLSAAMLALVSLWWLTLVAGLLASPDGRHPVPERLLGRGYVDFHIVLPCWVPDQVAEAPSVGRSPTDSSAALVSYAPRRPSHALGGLVPSRVGLFIEEKLEPFGPGSLRRLPGTRQRVGDVDVVLAPERDDPSLRTVTWVQGGLRFEMVGAGISTDDMLAVVAAMRESCSRAAVPSPATAYL